jgi:hypothetical protein
MAATATACAAVIGTIGLIAPSAQAQAPATTPSPSAATATRAQDTTTPPGVEVQSTTVTRPDGTQAQFAIYSINTAVNQTLWFHTQSTPGGPFGAWTQISGLTVNFQNSVLTAAAEADGSLELFTILAGTSTLVRLHQDGQDGPWSAPERFGPDNTYVPRFFGAPVAFQRSDGTLVLFEVYENVGAPELYVNEQSAPGQWDSWTDLGAGPMPASVATPSAVTEAPDGTLTVVSHMWDGPSWFARISETAPGGPWGPWQTCSTANCANG